MRIEDVKKSLNRNVTFRGSEYIFSGCLIRKNKKTNQFFYQAELLDVQTGLSVVYAGLEDIHNETEQEDV